ncbi:MAG: undecaprenyl phosphate translocase family protein [Flavobacteriaceae bacterium]
MSGGLVAFVLGFYEEFIDSLQKFNVEGVKLIKQGEFKIFYRHINGQFLGLLLFGMIVSYFSVSRILDYLLNHYEIYVWSLFFGLIIGSLLFIYRRVESFKVRDIFLDFIGVYFWFKFKSYYTCWTK